MPTQSLLRRPLAAVVLLAAATGPLARADVKLPGLFTNNMVLQRDMAVPVWGWADPGEQVTVRVAGKTASAQAGDDGKWSVSLAALDAGGPYVLTVKGNNTLRVEGVLVGEVWLCSGQSNMAMTVSRAARAAEETAAADYPKIRMFTVPRRAAAEPQSDVTGQWTVCSPETAGRFSAAAYFFGRKLHKTLDVPIGLINSSVGGTPIEMWTSRAALDELLRQPPIQKRIAAGAKTNPGAGLYNAMIAPLAPYALRGAIWYQGERNSKLGDPYLYRYELPAMIANWRADWRQGDFPFLYVQLPNFKTPQAQPVETDGWVLVREGMLQTLSVPNTGMAVTVDIGEAGNIHPKNKQEVGRRLALWALGTTYGKTLVYSGPIYKSAEKAAGKIVVRFDHTGGGLVAKGDDIIRAEITAGTEIIRLAKFDGPLRGFAIAGENRKFVRAEAKIVGQTVEVSSPAVPEPVAVRYAWAPNPDCNLYNKEGLPASPFRTDDWAPAAAK